MQTYCVHNKAFVSPIRWILFLAKLFVQRDYIHCLGREKQRSICKRRNFIDWRKSRYNFKENSNKFKIQIQWRRLFPNVLPLSPLRLLELRAWGAVDRTRFSRPNTKRPNKRSRRFKSFIGGKNRAWATCMRMAAPPWRGQPTWETRNHPLSTTSSHDFH